MKDMIFLFYACPLAHLELLRALFFLWRGKLFFFSASVIFLSVSFPRTVVASVTESWSQWSSFEELFFGLFFAFPFVPPQSCCVHRNVTGYNEIFLNGTSSMSRSAPVAATILPTFILGRILMVRAIFLP